MLKIKNLDCSCSFIIIPFTKESGGIVIKEVKLCDEKEYFRVLERVYDCRWHGVKGFIIV